MCPRCPTEITPVCEQGRAALASPLRTHRQTEKPAFNKPESCYFVFGFSGERGGTETHFSFIFFSQ